jgi:hypothetical protein
MHGRGDLLLRGILRKDTLEAFDVVGDPHKFVVDVSNTLRGHRPQSVVCASKRDSETRRTSIKSMIGMTALRAVLRGGKRSEASRTALKTSFRFVHAVWAADDPSSSTSGAGDGSVESWRADAVMNGASEWDDIVDGNGVGTWSSGMVMGATLWRIRRHQWDRFA